MGGREYLGGGRPLQKISHVLQDVLLIILAEKGWGEEIMRRNWRNWQNWRNANGRNIWKGLNGGNIQKKGGNGWHGKTRMRSNWAKIEEWKENSRNGRFNSCKKNEIMIGIKTARVNLNMQTWIHSWIIQYLSIEKWMSIIKNVSSMLIMKISSNLIDTVYCIAYIANTGLGWTWI